ncbi:MAG: hypothetical protein PHI87_05615, partial [Candidatus Methanomethylophilus sp.]|nr:hypothetical protein [Methanomethylophilus sp.]
VAAKASGDTEGETAARVKLGQLQKQLREHVAKYDLYRDTSREQIGQKVTAIRPKPGTSTPPKAPPAPPKPTPRKPDTRAIGEAFSDIPGAQAAAVSLINDAPENVRAAWNVIAPRIRFDSKSEASGAWYDPQTRGLTMNTKNVAKGDAVHPKFSTFYHESGHALDHLAGSGGEIGKYAYMSMTYKDGAFGKALRADAENAVKHQTGRTLTEQRAELTRALTEADLQSYGDVSDIMQQATKNKVHGQVGHWKKVLVQRHPNRYKNYWELKGSLEKEAFAEMYSSVVSNPGSLENLKTFFPNAYKVFNEILDEIAKKGATP